MDADRFDAIARSLFSRRTGITLTAATLLNSATSTEARNRKKKRRKRKKCKGGTTKCGKQCVTLSTDPANCGACGVACQAGLPCQGGACRATIGTCTAGQDSCASGVAAAIPCNAASGISDCYCGTNVADKTVCARILASMPCGCTTDAECQTREFPADLGGGTYSNAFCLKTSPAGPCATFCSTNVCVIPCQRLQNEN